MTFLAPVAGIIAGTLGLIGVLVSYFLKLRRRPVRIATTLLWEQAVQDLQVNAPFRWLRASWLLLLQLLVVACVALAIARPALEGDGPTADRVIIIIDASASMSATDAGGAGGGGSGGRSRFDDARERAASRIQRLPNSSRVMVIATAATAQTVIGFTRDHAAAVAALRAVEPTDQPGDLAGAMQVVRAYAQSSARDEDEALPVIYIYTDGADAPAGGLGVPVPRDRVRLVRVGPEPDAPKDNTGLAAIAARRDFDDPTLVRLFARVVNAAPEPVEATVRLLLDGNAIEARTVRVPAADDAAPGEAPVTFELRDSDGALALLSIATDDALEADNEAALVIAPPAAPRIAVVQPGEALSIPEEFLVDALYAGEPASVERLGAEAYTRRTDDPAWFASVDLIVFDGVFPDEPPPVPTLTFGRPSPGETVTQRVAYWSRSHPVMRYLAMGNVIATAPADYQMIEREGARNDVLASGETSTLIGAVEHRGLRRVLVSFRVQDSTWARDGSFPVFIANAVDWLTLTSAREAATASTTSRPAVLFDDALAGGATVTLRGPGGLTRTAIAEPSGRVIFGVLPRAGLYTADLPSGRRTLAVNLASASESAIRTNDTPVVAGPAGQGGAGPATPGVTEVWRWFILAALALLALEWALYAWKMRL